MQKRELPYALVRIKDPLMTRVEKLAREDHRSATVMVSVLLENQLKIVEAKKKD